MSNFRSKAGHPLPPLPGETRPKSFAALESTSLIEPQACNGVRLRQNPSDKPPAGLLSCTGTPIPGRKMRPLSADTRLEAPKHEAVYEDHQINDIGGGENKNQLQLLMYIVGGREVGQVIDNV